MTRITRRLTAKNRDQLRNPTLCNVLWATFTFFFYLAKMPNSCLQLFISMKLELYANNAILLKSNFQVHQHNQSDTSGGYIH